ncbi:fasciclin domain-containing protein, partial [Brevundimonas sp.]|uniref:fasciclin domain-containing protein n=1 Tax=Brevundimonas sp. TaxID=1871086 RepID=UPI002FC581DB
MLRLRLLTATAAAALLAAPALAQTAPTPPPPSPVPAAPTTAAPAMPAPAATSAEPADEATPAPQTPTAQVPAAAPAQAAGPATPAAAGNVIDVLTGQGNFTTLLAALNQAQLSDTLRSRPAITIFAPTDEAFAALPEAERTRLMDPANAGELRNLLLYHVIVADVSSSQITGTRGGVPTANRTRVLLDGTGEGLRIDGAMITRADIDASNGSIFAIDKVLDPARSMAPPETTAAAPAADGATATTRPAAPGTTAPNGQPAATTTTIASPPVPNPTDGQVDR